MEPRRPENFPVITGDIQSLHRYEGWENCLAKVEEHFATKVIQVEQITKGGNNGVFLLEDTAKNRVVGKFYQRDSRNRLDREWNACTFLRRRDFAVPDPLFRDTDANFAVYSFESGQHVSSEEASEDDVFGLIDTLCRLHSFTPAHISEVFPDGIMAWFCSEDVAKEIDERFHTVLLSAEDGVLHPRVSKMITETNILGEIQNLLASRLAASSASRWEVPTEGRRLSPVDFGFHNALFRGIEPPCIVDLEYFGWDDPLHSAADFLTHDKTQGLSEVLRQKAIDRYAMQMRLSSEEQERLDLMCELCDIRFLAIYLQSVTPRYLAARAFAATGDFDAEKYISEQLEKIQKRRERIHLAN